LIAIFDYGSGNLRSAQRAFETTGEDVKVTSNVSEALNAKGVVIPGVGAFAACMSQLISAGGDELITQRVASGNSIFGICVGMQVLFSSSNEKGEHDGVGIFSGKIERMQNSVLPQIGWNTVEAESASKLFKGIEKDSFYFVHSYAAKVAEANSLNTFANYGEKFIAAVERDNVCATQFHPEKSGKSGLKLINNWVQSI
jgi:glutamine amidotransferase